MSELRSASAVLDQIRERLLAEAESSVAAANVSSASIGRASRRTPGSTPASVWYGLHSGGKQLPTDLWTVRPHFWSDVCQPRRYLPCSGPDVRGCRLSREQGRYGRDGRSHQESLQFQRQRAAAARAAERERKLQEPEAGKAAAEQLNTELGARTARLESILRRGLDRESAIDLNAMVRHDEFPPLAPHPKDKQQRIRDHGDGSRRSFVTSRVQN